MPRRRYGDCQRCRQRQPLVRSEDLCAPCWRILRERRPTREASRSPQDAAEVERRIRLYRQRARDELPLFDP